MAADEAGATGHQNRPGRLLDRHSAQSSLTLIGTVVTGEPAGGMIVAIRKRAGWYLNGRRNEGEVHAAHAVLTGGAGFLGSHLADRLLAEGLDVTVLDNFSNRLPGECRPPAGPNGFRLIKLDVLNYISIPEPVDYVLHFASPASPIDYAEMLIQTMKVGSLGTLNTLGLAMEKGARYLLASTSEAYGDPLVHPQPKATGEMSTRSAPAVATTRPNGSPRRSRRPTGPSTASTPRFSDLQHLRASDAAERRPGDPDVHHQALAGTALTVQGDGSQTRSVCYVDDLIDGALRLLFSDLPGPVNVGNPNEMTVLELAELIRELTGSDSRLNFVERAQDDPSQRQPDITLARTALHWETAGRRARRPGQDDRLVPRSRSRHATGSLRGRHRPAARADTATPQPCRRRHRLRRRRHRDRDGVPSAIPCAGWTPTRRGRTS